MPYFKWVGIDLSGNICKGVEFARTEDFLDKLLLYQDIGLIKAKKRFAFLTFVPLKDRNDAIHHLSILLSASVRVAQALEVVAGNIKNRYLKMVFKDIHMAVCEGVSLYEALSYHGVYFNELTRAIVDAGEKSGSISNAFEQLAYHNEIINSFKSKVRSALLVPCFTIIFFVLVMISIFIFVIPRFEIFFSSVKEPLPAATQLVFYISNLIRSLSIVYLFLAALILVAILRFVFTKSVAKKYKDKLILFIPIVGKFNKLVYQARFLHIISILLCSGVHLAQALMTAQNSIDNFEVKSAIGDLLNEIYDGESMHLALHNNNFFASSELEALVEIGDSSGNLAPLFKHASSIYQKKVYAIINNIVTLVQPLLLIVLGLCVAVLIFAVYVPIFTLSTIVK